ncbi:hypothetical protein [Burkholderia territorii]|uniref:hypothetical protein n=1 Tax=Burkholderia territorii TaxID=1503055 RepID=UPI001E5272A0|nr:hypothetical protein [Burkholderia territorii]
MKPTTFDQGIHRRSESAGSLRFVGPHGVIRILLCFDRFNIDPNVEQIGHGFPRVT